MQLPLPLQLSLLLPLLSSLLLQLQDLFIDGKKKTNKQAWNFWKSAADPRLLPS
jgi:hypothetical protein